MVLTAFGADCRALQVHALACNGEARSQQAHSCLRRGLQDAQWTLGRREARGSVA